MVEPGSVGHVGVEEWKRDPKSLNPLSATLSAVLRALCIDLNGPENKDTLKRASYHWALS